MFPSWLRCLQAGQVSRANDIGCGPDDFELEVPGTVATVTVISGGYRGPHTARPLSSRSSLRVPQQSQAVMLIVPPGFQ